MPALRKRMELWAGTGMLKVLRALARWCPDRLVAPMGGGVGWLIWTLSRRYRNVALKNLRAVYGGQKDEREIQALARAVFRHWGQAAVECFWGERLKSDKLDKLFDVDHIERLDQALARGKGVLFVTAHFGNFDIMARWLANRGYKVTVIARDSDDPAQTGIVNEEREGAGYQVLSKTEPAGRMIEALRANRILGILPDQNTIEKPVFVPFFGRLASVAPGVAVLAMRTDCTVLPGFGVRIRGGRFRLELLPPLETPKEGGFHERLCAISADFTRVIEEEIRKYPEQWLWFHDRWRKRPPEEEQAGGQNVR